MLGTIAADRTRVVANGGHAGPGALVAGYHLAWILGAASVAIGLVVSLLVLPTPRPPRAEEVPTRVAVEAEVA